MSTTKPTQHVITLMLENGVKQELTFGNGEKNAPLTECYLIFVRNTCPNGSTFEIDMWQSPIQDIAHTIANHLGFQPKI